MSAILFVLLLSYAVTIAIFMFGLELVRPLGVTFFGLLTALLNFLAQLAIYCYFSENVTHDLLATSDLFYESPWYRLPYKLQKLYVVPIARAQRQFRLTGLGIIECSLRVFASVAIA